MSQLLRPVQVAERLGRSKTWLHQNVARLRRDHQFPAPVPGLSCRGYHVYDPQAIDEWLARLRAPGSGLVADAALDAEPDWAKILDERAASFARSGGSA